MKFKQNVSVIRVWIWFLWSWFLCINFLPAQMESFLYLYLQEAQLILAPILLQIHFIELIGLRIWSFINLLKFMKW